MPAPALDQYTPQEAAAIAGVRLGRIQNAITNRQLGRTFSRGGGRRKIDLPAVLTFALLDRLRNVHVEPKTLYDAFRKSGVPKKPIAVTEGVTIDAPHLLESVIKNIVAYNAARKRIVADPGVMGGLPIIKGTRVPARSLHARVKGGDTVESILKEYPYLDREAIDSAVLFVEANPTRGRPQRRKNTARG